MMQLDIFGLPPSNLTGELPTAIAPVDPKLEAALQPLGELRQIANAQFQIGTRIIAGDLRGEIASIDNEVLYQVRFDGELKPRQVFIDSLELEPDKPELSEGCIVRSQLFFKGKTAKVISFEQIGSVTLATVELELNGYLTRFPCGISALEVIE
jgi:hypothetical protein